MTQAGKDVQTAFAAAAAAGGHPTHDSVQQRAAKEEAGL